METIHLVLLGFITEVAVGKYQAICQMQPAIVKEGDDVNLPCHLLPSFDVSAYTVEWKRVDQDKVVHLYRHRKDDSGPQMEWYRNRTKLNHTDLSRGILDLQISPVQLSDSGEYRCHVPKLTASCTYTITVEKKDEKDKPTIIDFSTTQTPPKEVTRPSNPDGEAVKAVSVVCCAIFIAAIIAVIIRTWVKCGTIQNCTDRLRGRKEMATNECTTERLNTQEVGGGQSLENHAENS